MKSSELREKFLSYFEKKGHARVRSSPLVPANDPTLFFTNAGMVQFKEVFLGQEKREYQRACSSQKCMRVSGKHNDLENVGHTPRHHTFFEMLGNFSFGDYFKKEAIAYAWEFLTKELGLDQNRLWITVFEDDDEAEKLWTKHVAKDRIFRLGEKDNFWAMGETGPCGPCSEILWDFGSGPVTKEDLATDRFMEIWNLVFMQFNRDVQGNLTSLAAPCIDTGMGLERLAAVVQGKHSNWETDLFKELIDKARQATNAPKNLSAEQEVALKVIADHARGMTFLIADGVVPSNEGRGYVLRRIMRRAIRFGKKIGQDKPFLTKVAHAVIDEMGDVYVELAQHQHLIEKVILAEEERFLATLDKGLEILQNAFVKLKHAKKTELSGDVVFKLYDTFGFPKDLTEIICAEQGLKLDDKGFEKQMNEQRERARASWKGSGEEKVADVYRELLSSGIKSKFTGYDQESSPGKVLAVLKDGKLVDKANPGDEVGIIADQTPFYGESGGQVGDIGLAVKEGVEIEIKNTKRPLPEIILHQGVVKKGKVEKGAQLTFAIDSERRQDICCNHTATHLLHRALREVLGEHVKQSGSLVSPEYFRFDFSHFEALTPEQIQEVETRVNKAVRQNFSVNTEEVSYNEAIERGALAFFGEKYGEKVRLIEIKGFSIELCGGTHLKATGEIGLLKITAESSVAAGIRRIEVITGRAAERYVAKLENDQQEIAKALKSSPAEVKEKVAKLLAQTSKLEKELKAAKMQQATGQVNDWQKDIKKISEVPIHVAVIDIQDRKALATIAEDRLAQMKSGLVLVAAQIEDKITIIGATTKDLAGKKVHVGNIIKAVSEEFDGKGGGRPDFAQGGGRAVEKIGDFENIVWKCVEKLLKS
ncbi:MAG: alanine--tRNA ligase [Pseudomonadota bacterium]